jgi:hypothetical protein
MQQKAQNHREGKVIKTTIAAITMAESSSGATSLNTKNSYAGELLENIDCEVMKDDG